MSKNLTRKGLALGALVALGASVFAGAPAFATVSDKIGLAPSAGTTYSTIAGASFELENRVDSSIKTADNKDVKKLAYLVTNSGAASITVSLNGANDHTYGNLKYASADSADKILTSPSAYNASGVASVTAKDKAIVVKGDGANTADASDSGYSNFIKIGSTTDATDAFDVSVTAFIDENSNGIIDAGEYTSATQTIHFIPVASAVVTTSIKSATLGTGKVQAKVSIDGVNLKSLKNQVSVGFFTAGTSKDTLDNGTVTADASYDASVDALVNGNYFTLANGTHIASGDVITAQAYIGTGIKLGSVSGAASTTNGTAVSVDSTDILKTTNSANTTLTKDTTLYSTTMTAGSTSSTAVKTGYTGDITFTSQLKSADSSDVSDSGVTVKVTLSKGTTFDAASTFTAGGKVLTATSGSVSFTTTSSSTGGITFTGASNSGKKGDIVNVGIQVLTTAGYRPAATAYNTNVLTWADAALTKSVVTSGVIGKQTASTLHIAKGGSSTITLAAVDQFGQAITATGYRYLVTVPSVDGATSQTLYANVTNGVATAAFTDSSTTTGSYSVTAQLQKLTGTAWATAVDGSSVSIAQNSVVVYVDSLVPATVSATVPTSSVATIAKTLVSADLRADNNTKTATSIGYSGTAVTVAGTVTTAAGQIVAGQDVTIAGTGLGFVSVDGLVYKTGSITVQADANGAYQVSVFSTTAGAATVTVTAGAATVSKTITFSGITTLDSKGTIAIDVASLSQVGRAVTVSFLVKDSLGNPVKATDALSVSLTGVGSLSATKVTTDATGTGTVQFLAGANDFGDAVITAKYTVTSAGVDTVVSASKTVTVGVTDAQVDIVGKRVTAVSSFTKGRTVAFYVDGVKKWSKLSASDADVVLYYNLKAGTHTVTVKISGGFVTTEKFIVQ